MTFEKPTAIKLKIIKEGEWSELRRLKFTPGDGSSRTSLVAYQMALCSSVLKSLGDMYPDLPMGSFNDKVVLKAKDEDGDMVRFSSVQEFAQAMSSPDLYMAGETMRLEVRMLETASEVRAVAEAEAIPAADATPAPSENGSGIAGSFDADMLRSSTSVFSSVAGSPSVSSASTATLRSPTPSFAESATLPLIVPEEGGNIRDPAAPARAFLTQVLPSLADVLARSMYANQWMPQILPNGNIVPPPGAPSISPLAEQQQQLNADEPAEATATARVAGVAGTVPATTAVNMAAAATSTRNDIAGHTAPAPASSSASGTRSEPATADTPAVHNGIVCDGCDMSPIMGTRYKCAVRSDFDLCEACESAAGRDSPFPFLKIRTPAHSPAAIVCLLKPDQPANVEEASSFARSSGPRPGRSYGIGQARRAPQRGGWGEGRRNCQRWMRDLARRQSMAAAGGGYIPPCVDVVHGNASAWRGPRMQRHMQDGSIPLSQRNAEVTKPSEGAATPAANNEDQPTRPPSVVSGSLDEQGDVDNVVESTADDTKKTAEKIDATLTESAVAEASQSTDYHDMLAASMRSLASSMTASLPNVASSQDSKSHGSGPTVGDAKPQGKPMARFVTDVSVADGSPLPPNTRFVKTWCMRNDGAIIFPPECRLMPVSGDLMGGPEEGVMVEQRAPGEEFHVSVTLTTPPLSGRYIGYWRLRTAEGQNFGHRIWADVLVTGGTADLVLEGSLDGDWDLVNMQRLSKAVESTAKDVENAATDAAAAATAATVPAAAACGPNNTPSASTTTTETPVGENSAAYVGAERPPALVGHEETKSSDVEEGSAAPTSTNTSPPAVEVIASVASAPTTSVPTAATDPGATAKWHRELCSLAEMGFENTARNIDLLEKHVTSSGNGGMERVLHELLSWTEFSIQ